MTSATENQCEYCDGSKKLIETEVDGMTDNRTTELLREGLTERGIEWRSGLEGVTFVGDWCFVEYDNGKLAATCEPVLTPEQAIAATLGSDREAELIRAIEDVLRHATDTVWVSETETLIDRMVSLGVYGHDVDEGARPWEADE